MPSKTVFIHSISSDIGLNLAKRYASEGYRIAGTYRSEELLGELRKIDGIQLFYCNLLDPQSIDASTQAFAELGWKWNTYVSCASTCTPLQAFFQAKFDEWINGVRTNALEHLRALHSLYSYRDSKSVSHVVFFTGPGTNGAPKNFSSAVIAKIMLFKMCELLQVENDDLNIFIIGPGWTKTKTHFEILASPHISKEKYDETMEFLRNREGTSMDDIYQCIRWLENQGRDVSGGRNFSVVNDLWGNETLANALLSDPDMYKLRRYKNEWNPHLVSESIEEAAK